MDELSIQKLLTKQFIDSDPSVITLTPQTKQRTASGGSEYVAGTPRKPQTFKLITMTDTTRPTPTSDGVERLFDFTLLGEFDAVVDVHDFWMIGDQKYVIVELVPFNLYEVKALVSKHGKG